MLLLQSPAACRVHFCKTGLQAALRAVIWLDTMLWAGLRAAKKSAAGPKTRKSSSRGSAQELHARHEAPGIDLHELSQHQGLALLHQAGLQEQAAHSPLRMCGCKALLQEPCLATQAFAACCLEHAV